MLNLEGSNIWAGGTRRLDQPHEPETRRQLLQRHRARFIGSSEFGNSTVTEKPRQAQVEVTAVAMIGLMIRVLGRRIEIWKTIGGLMVDMRREYGNYLNMFRDARYLTHKLWKFDLPFSSHSQQIGNSAILTRFGLGKHRLPMLIGESERTPYIIELMYI